MLQHTRPQAYSKQISVVFSADFFQLLNIFSLITARTLLMIVFILDFETMTGKPTIYLHNFFSLHRIVQITLNPRILI